MKIEIISYQDLHEPLNDFAQQQLENALLTNGIVGISDVPGFVEKSQAYINVVRQFAKLPEEITKQYAPNRDAGQTEGYELGAEWFKDQDGNWRPDDKKSSYYALVPDSAINIWPKEIDLKTPYLELGNLIFETAKKIVSLIGLTEEIGLKSSDIHGYGRMLHYHGESDEAHPNPEWCGAHLDHGLFTGLMPAYYFQDGIEIEEPDETGLYIIPHSGQQFEKVYALDKSVMLFQAGEFGQLASNDRIRATKHLVKKAYHRIERYAFALFLSVSKDFHIKSTSELTEDLRYQNNRADDGSISFDAWEKASYENYRSK
jgi:isopenicillin N synthase-like dioxygenase